MALKQGGGEQKQQVPGFEQEDNSGGGSAVVEKTTAAAAAPAETPKVDAPAAAAQAAAAIDNAAKSSAVAVRKPGGKLDDFIGRLENRLPRVEFGESPRLVVASGVIKDADKHVLGTHMELTLLSWNYKYVVRTGEQGDSAKEFVKFSNDPAVFADGSSIADYIQKLKTVDGFTKASLEEYVELVGIVESSEKPWEGTGQGITVVSCAPDSVKTFKSVRRDTAVGVMLGQIEPVTEPRIKLTVEARAFKGKDWSRFNITYVKPAA